MAMATLVKLVSRPTRLLQHSHSVSMVTTQSHHGSQHSHRQSTVTARSQSQHSYRTVSLNA